MDARMRTLLFLALLLGSVLINLAFFKQLLVFSLDNEFSSHVLLVPLMSTVLIFQQREKIFQQIRSSILMGGIICSVAIALPASINLMQAGSKDVDSLSVKTLAIALWWIGVFLFCYGRESFRRALFPLLLLLLMIPIPKALLDAIVSILERGTADMTAFLFKITGTPYYRDHLFFVLPRISIQIADQCSGIRSSLALLISCLLSAHLMLRTTWRKSILVAIAVPMAMVKNAVRIAVLCLLSIHVDKRFLISSDLHHKGGIVFFLLALTMMLPILWALRRSERRSNLRKNDGLSAA